MIVLSFFLSPHVLSLSRYAKRFPFFSLFTSFFLFISLSHTHTFSLCLSLTHKNTRTNTYRHTHTRTHSLYQSPAVTKPLSLSPIQFNSIGFIGIKNVHIAKATVEPQNTETIFISLLWMVVYY